MSLLLNARLPMSGMEGRPSKGAPVLGRFQNGVYSMEPLLAIAYWEIHHFETPTALSNERPALPVPRPGRDREVLSFWNIVVIVLLRILPLSAHAS